MIADGRTPHGVRGLKCGQGDRVDNVAGAHPARGTWIEMTRRSSCCAHWSGRTPHGVRGLKLQKQDREDQDAGRTPHGVRGLKCQAYTQVLSAV